MEQEALSMETLSSKFSASFQTRMLAVAATQPFFLDLYLDIFKPSLFTSQYHRDISSWIADFYRKYKMAPSRSSLRKILIEHVPKDAPLYRGYKTLLDQIYGNEILDSEYIKDQIVVASKFQAMKGALVKMSEQLDVGDFDSLSHTFNSALQVGSGVGDLGMRMTKSVDKVLLKYGFLEQSIRTGFRNFENSIGGLYDSELTVIVAPPNQGKTAYLGNLAYGAARHDNEVMYYTLEIGAERMLSRFYSRMTQIRTKELHSSIKRVRGSVKRFSVSTAGNITVKFFPAGTITVDTLRNHLAMAKGNGITPPLVVIDYADKLRPSNPKDPPPDRLRQIYTDLRALGHEFKCHVMTASQSRRSTLYAKMIDLDDLAESWGKAQESDSIVCVCQTREEKSTNVARLYYAKTRNETSGRFSYTKNNYSTLSISEIDRKQYARTMNRAGFKIPDDTPQLLRRSKNSDEELDNKYDS
jgi:replicative DNA helicase